MIMKCMNTKYVYDYYIQFKNKADWAGINFPIKVVTF